jgi:hypothetical protein
MTRAIPILLLCVLAHGQDAPVRDAAPPGRQTGPFRFSISADKAIYQPDETIIVTSVLRNEADHSISLAMGPPISFYGKDIMLPAPAWLPFRSLAVHTEEGQQLELPPFTSAASHILKPGGEIVAKFELNKIYAMPVPGEYHVVFHFPAPDFVGKGVVVLSNEIVVTIAEKK